MLRVSHETCSFCLSVEFFLAKRKIESSHQPAVMFGLVTDLSYEQLAKNIDFLRECSYLDLTQECCVIFVLLLFSEAFVLATLK